MARSLTDTLSPGLQGVCVCGLCGMCTCVLFVCMCVCALYMLYVCMCPIVKSPEAGKNHRLNVPRNHSGASSTSEDSEPHPAPPT